MKFLIAALLLCSLPVWASGLKIEGVTFPETLTRNKQTLQLNGVALRKVEVLFMDFNVYVAGLYVVHKSTDANALISSKELMFLDMHFLRSVSTDQLKDHWKESLEKNCTHCKAEKPLIQKFISMMVDVGEDSHIELTFQGDELHVDVTGAHQSHGQIKDAGFVEDLKRVFVGDHPPSVEFKKGLLGLH